MADVLSALYRKRSLLHGRKTNILLDAEREAKAIDNEIAKIDRALALLNDAVKGYLCPHCGGTGSVRKCDAAGQMDDDTCPSCRGTGVRIGEEG